MRVNYFHLISFFVNHFGKTPNWCICTQTLINQPDIPIWCDNCSTDLTLEFAPNRRWRFTMLPSSIPPPPFEATTVSEPIFAVEAANSAVVGGELLLSSLSPSPPAQFPRCWLFPVVVKVASEVLENGRFCGDCCFRCWWCVCCSAVLEKIDGNEVVATKSGGELLLVS